MGRTAARFALSDRLAGTWRSKRRAAACTPPFSRPRARDTNGASVAACWTGSDGPHMPPIRAKGAIRRLMVEWRRRLDDFDRKGWHNITGRLDEPEVEYLGLVNREGEKGEGVRPHRGSAAGLRRRLGRSV